MGLLTYDNISLALVLPNMHPPHIAFEKDNAEDYGKLKKHRDGTSSVYINDPSNNSVEILKNKLSQIIFPRKDELIEKAWCDKTDFNTIK